MPARAEALLSEVVICGMEDGARPDVHRMPCSDWHERRTSEIRRDIAFSPSASHENQMKNGCLQRGKVQRNTSMRLSLGDGRAASTLRQHDLPGISPDNSDLRIQIACKPHPRVANRQSHSRRSDRRSAAANPMHEMRFPGLPAIRRGHRRRRSLLQSMSAGRHAGRAKAGAPAWPPRHRAQP